MARKILISFLGAGTPTEMSTSRDYKKARYRFNNQEQESPFIASVLLDFLKIDAIYLVGTARSMWEAVYQHFTERKDLTFDEDYALKLYECSTATHESPLNNSLIQPIEEIISAGSKVRMIKYGLNEDEIKENFNIFASLLNENLKDGDSIYLDITHSFRSLPLFANTAITYIQDVSLKKVTLAGVFYGNLDVTSELDYTPIIDMTYILNLQNWIKGAYSFSNFGNGYLISELLKDENPNAAKKIESFTNVININYLHEIKSQINTLTSLQQSSFHGPASLVVPQTLKNFTKHFRSGDALSTIQLELSKWHRDNKNFALSYIALVESIISFVCECNALNTEGHDNREQSKSILKSDDRYTALHDIWKSANKIRNSIAHLFHNDRLNMQTDINELIKYQRATSHFFSSHK